MKQSKGKQTLFARWMRARGLATDDQAARELGLSRDQVRNLRNGTRRGKDARAVAPDRRTRLAMSALLAALKPYGE